ncbi:uncharacterized protein F5Z01DRAFT_478286 [Emericellopsis atlantica]|uniref:Uncharacterized protein n=1 Tax=Emericellopsis atlantica TaxID=2614577 RepID=A0A9P8CRR4_9HYPO|nr:uncharacterized protein F5Z01DRAFT_478286 [Emericellopsis atlantica]KAG9256587.1 hypothetical protein F5Z01DRAFT_478286 [Emericellopsis atlantica]
MGSATIASSKQPPSFAQLEQAALHIIRLIRDTPGLENTKMAVVGDLALRHHLPECDRTASIDLVISKSSSPGRVRKEIVGHPMSPLVERSGMVFFKSPNRWEVEVKLIPDWLCPYLPDAARAVRDNTASLPYISLDDLIVFKADACGLRDQEASKRQEALDVAALLDLASEHYPLQIDEDKMDRIKQALDDLVEYSPPELDTVWWQRRLGKVTDNRDSIQTIMSELSDSFATNTPTSPGASSTRSSVYSTMSRTSSSLSTVSAKSMSSVSSSASSEPKSPEKNGRPRKMSMHGRHRRTTSGGVAPPSSLDAAVQRLHIGRPASPGVAFTNCI